MDNKLTEYILKHSKKKDKELKYDFMPSMLEIIERPAHKAGTVIILGIFTLLIVAIIWACLSKIDVVVTASGSMTPAGNINVIKTYASGTVSTIEVSEGVYVEKGDVLITLDTQSIDIDVESISNQKEILESQKEIYTMIKNGEDVSNIDVEKYSTNLQPYIFTIIDNDKAFQNNISILENVKENAGLTRDIAQIKYDDYNINPAVSIVEFNTQELVLKQAENEYLQAEMNILDAQTSYSEQVNASISDINSKLEQAESELEKYQLSLEYQKITAPVSGHIGSIAVNTIGESVTSAQELITIVPDNTPLEMVVYVKNMDIADIEMDMQVEIKLEAYPYNKYGTVKGNVKYISPSSFNSEQMGNVYLVKVEISDYDERIDLISGLSGSVEIKTDKRTIMDYFLEPIKKGFGESLKER